MTLPCKASAFVCVCVCVYHLWNFDVSYVMPVLNCSWLKVWSDNKRTLDPTDREGCFHLENTTGQDRTHLDVIAPTKPLMHVVGTLVVFALWAFSLPASAICFLRRSVHGTLHNILTLCALQHACLASYHLSKCVQHQRRQDLCRC